MWLANRCQIYIKECFVHQAFTNKRLNFSDVRTKFVRHSFPLIVEVRKYNCNYHQEFTTANSNSRIKINS